MTTSAPSNPFAREEVLALDARALDLTLALASTTAAWGDPGQEGDPMRHVELRGGVAIVRIEGPLAVSWWGESYPEVVARVKAALASPQARAVVLAITSPGGTVSGLFEAMRSIRTEKASAGKRLLCSVASQATSAAYALAACCDEIWVDETAAVGSIGVISTLTSRVDQLAQEGLDVRVITSGAEKADGHPAVPISEAALARAQERVTALAELLFTEIAASRPSLTVDAQRALEAGIRYGRQALTAGLADRVGTLDALLASLAPSTQTTAPRAAAAITKVNTMTETLAAFIAAKTGESDPERQLGALQALLTKAEAHDALATELNAIKARLEAEALAAQKAEALAAFERELAEGLTARKITEDEASWWRDEHAAGRATAASLNANLARRAAPVLAAADPAHLALRQPADTPRTAAADPRLPQLLAKPYGALTWDERNTLAALDPTAHDRVLAAWIEAGRPKG